MVKPVQPYPLKKLDGTWVYIDPATDKEIKQMNKRIKLLAEEANCNIDVMGYGEGNLEKFAELIIDDCLKMCLTSVGNKDYNTGRMHCYNNIKEHFGVE